MSKTWILVAESSRARLFSAEHKHAPLHEMEGISHPEGRLHEGDLVSDHVGSDGGSVGQGRHNMDNPTSAKVHESQKFAKQLAEHLNTARKQGDFSNLVLMAPPEFLGHLRGSLDKDTLSMVSRQVDKNLTAQPIEVLISYLRN